MVGGADSHAAIERLFKGPELQPFITDASVKIDRPNPVQQVLRRSRHVRQPGEHCANRQAVLLFELAIQCDLLFLYAAIADRGESSFDVAPQLLFQCQKFFVFAEMFAGIQTLDQ